MQTELYRTDAYDGVAPADITRLEYSTFARAHRRRRRPSARLPASQRRQRQRRHHDTSLFFFPANNGTVVNGEWQNWDVTGGKINVDGDNGGEMTLADYAAAHPDATLVNTRTTQPTTPVRSR